jgi:phospholipase C
LGWLPWSAAQRFSMSDNSFGTSFGPSTPGALNLISGNTGGVARTIKGAATNGDVVNDGIGGYSMISDAQPYYDDCSTRDAASMSGTNVGDLLNRAGLSWGFFQGGFSATTPYSGPTDTTLSYDPTSLTAPKAACAATHPRRSRTPSRAPISAAPAPRSVASRDAAATDLACRCW